MKIGTRQKEWIMLIQTQCQTNGYYCLMRRDFISFRKVISSLQRRGFIVIECDPKTNALQVIMNPNMSQTAQDTLTMMWLTE